MTDLLCLREALALGEVSRSTIFRSLRSGELLGRMIGGRWFVEHRDLLRWKAQRRAASRDRRGRPKRAVVIVVAGTSGGTR